MRPHIFNQVSDDLKVPEMLYHQTRGPEVAVCNGSSRCSRWSRCRYSILVTTPSERPVHKDNEGPCLGALGRGALTTFPLR